MPEDSSDKVSETELLGTASFVLFIFSIGLWLFFWTSHRKHGQLTVGFPPLVGVHDDEHQFAGSWTSYAVFATLDVVFLVAFAAATIWFSRRPSIHPVFAAILAVLVLIFVVSSYSYAYFISGGAGRWSLTLSHVDAIYVALGTLTTAGTNGITPESDYARFQVVGQMVVDFVVVTGMVGIVVARLTRGN